ncbi:hypothetical protein BB560_005322 [Smittium megazygosporum]|uniref:Uncharacterized protein n=1 Tax=Smittium megazygosporum TaxID=133381 RepID=A0A2T9Z6S3_9FUNG|nr:hypothetical protein BB560_005322 [Smittium megazygosporum]
MIRIGTLTKPKEEDYLIFNYNDILVGTSSEKHISQKISNLGKPKKASITDNKAEAQRLTVNKSSTKFDNIIKEEENTDKTLKKGYENGTSLLSKYYLLSRKGVSLEKTVPHNKEPLKTTFTRKEFYKVPEIETKTSVTGEKERLSETLNRNSVLFKDICFKHKDETPVDPNMILKPASRQQLYSESSFFVSNQDLNSSKTFKPLPKVKDTKKEPMLITETRYDSIRRARSRLKLEEKCRKRNSLAKPNSMFTKNKEDKSKKNCKNNFGAISKKKLAGQKQNSKMLGKSSKAIREDINKSIKFAKVKLKDAGNILF